ncbi:uncharacterized protein EI97DRAFT_484313 [Westerdykella ornata]|uniref:Coupling of ubiquitin conjugation to ER degradation protein 1 n=1 Tax=Westerdykella ornata TaxID=318751 RepID=A0A6A6JUK7_WESOR|nr:uncharacterized protein EI97DRAFT_484313 [Westerdykella ornata]KAF2278719.1 hypothetical protein EI97DRAFT_484313 [Westerdykella ornata]
MAEQTLNIPQLVVFLLVSYFAIRWYLKPSSGDAQPAGGRRAPTVTAAQVDQLAQMFPQFDRRQIAWDLTRNGGNMAATTERVLSGSGLETPPASFTAPPSQSASARPTPTNAPKPSQPDLITRYNLASKLNSTSENSSEAPQKTKTWSQDKNERQAMLQRRREEMILTARRKMEEKQKAKS